MTQKPPRVLSLRFAKKPRHGIHVYANVQSRSRGTRVIHVVTGRKYGRGYRWHCSCEAKSFNPEEQCIHVKAVVKRIKYRAARLAAALRA